MYRKFNFLISQPKHTLWVRGPDKLSVQLGIYPTRFLRIAFFQKQLLKNIFLPHLDFEIAYLEVVLKYLIILVNNLNNNLSYGRYTKIEVTLSTSCKYFSQ